jgi:hypothetical protein
MFKRRTKLQAITHIGKHIARMRIWTDVLMAIKNKGVNGYWRKIYCLLQEELEDTKWVIRIRKSKDRQHNGQKKKDKHRSTKHYAEI